MDVTLTPDSFGNGPKLPLRTRLTMELTCQKAWFKVKANEAFPAIVTFFINHGGGR